MARTGRPGLTQQQKKELWQRWRDGQSLSDIGRALGKHAGSVHGVLSATGGIQPTDRKRSPRSLRLCEREEISRGLAAGMSVRSIAAGLRRSASTVSREINRNGGLRRHRAVRTGERAWQRACRPKPCLLTRNQALCAIVAGKLACQWSPEQIAGWLKVEFSHCDETMLVSHETFYKSLFIQARGVLKKELLAHLRTNRMMRRSRKSTTQGQPLGQIIDAVSIRERPADVEDRAAPGHWEGDLLSGSANSHIATFVERKFRYIVLVHVAGKDTDSVVGALTREALKLPENLMMSLTWDRGSELAQHKRFSLATNVKVYFCDPQSPWQRGTNENTNRLLRQYFPKGTSLLGYSQADLDAVAMRLNIRPRKTLGFRSPADKLAEDVALTG